MTILEIILLVLLFIAIFVIMWNRIVIKRLIKAYNELLEYIDKGRVI